jgi:hypothetical protein
VGLLCLTFCTAVAFADEHPTQPQSVAAPRAAPAAEQDEATMAVAVLAGFDYEYFYDTSLYNAFAELRVGFRKRRIELTGRLRLGIGGTEQGLLFFQPTLGGGLLGELHPRVRLGFEIIFPMTGGLFVERITDDPNASTLMTSIFEFSAELQVDLVHRTRRALFLSILPGLMVGVTSDPAFISPSARIALGVRIL